MSTYEEIQNDIEALKARNNKVDINKTWEISLTRKIILMLITYFVVILTLFTIHNPEPFINALIPSLGFFLSTLTLPFIKKFWMQYIYKK